MEGEGKRPKSEPEELETLPKVLTDFGELETLPANARAVLLSHMSDIRQLIEFGRSNLERRRFLKRHRVFPMWFKRQCGFPEDMSDQEANMRITNLLARFQKEYAQIIWDQTIVLEFRYSTMRLFATRELCNRIVQNTHVTWKKTDWGLYEYESSGYAFFHFLKVVQVIDQFFPNGNVPLRSNTVNFDCTKPVDVLSLSNVLFFADQVLSWSIDHLDRPHPVTRLLWAVHSWVDQEDDNFCEHTYRVLTELFRDKKIKLTDLYFETRVSCSGSFWTM